MLPGKPVTYNYGLRWLIYGLLWGIGAIWLSRCMTPNIFCCFDVEFWYMRSCGLSIINNSSPGLSTPGSVFRCGPYSNLAVSTSLHPPSTPIATMVFDFAKEHKLWGEGAAGAA